MVAIGGLRQEDVAAVVGRVRELPGYPEFPAAAPAYDHMGAVLVDAGLQAGIDYVNVVQPRVRMVLEAWPEAKTTDAFLARIEAEGLQTVLQWSTAEKPGRIERLARLLADNDVRTVEQLGTWIMQATSRGKLTALHGIGDKTADYIANLAGQPVAAVDRHLRSFVQLAGVDPGRYREVHALLAAAAEDAHVHLGSLDREIWKFMSGGDQRRPLPVQSREADVPGAAVTADRTAPPAGDETHVLRLELERTRAERDLAVQALHQLREQLRAALEGSELDLLPT